MEVVFDASYLNYMSYLNILLALIFILVLALAGCVVLCGLYYDKVFYERFESKKQKTFSFILTSFGVIVIICTSVFLVSNLLNIVEDKKDAEYAAQESIISQINENYNLNIDVNVKRDSYESLKTPTQQIWKFVENASNTSSPVNLNLDDESKYFVIENINISKDRNNRTSSFNFYLYDRETEPKIYPGYSLIDPENVE